jgi:hypothetical protein
VGGVITSREFITGVMTGALLIVVALVPGLFQRIAEEVRSSIDAFSSAGVARPRRYDAIETPTLWLAGSGAALILVSVLGYF